MTEAWTTPVRLSEMRDTRRLRLEPDAVERAKVAKTLGLESLPALTADLTLKPWMDGVEITGRFEAVVEQLCAVSAEPFEHPLAGDIDVRVVPAGSPQADEAPSGELELDLDAPDPPDISETDAIDLSAYVVEHLALEINPFARKPGVEFAYEPPPEPDSPFAVLKKLKDDGP
ncbi:DUF177 domain-containing protein [Phenylobacterium sp.]|uniref:YceD family protein n=1 Tax=Phenylobacterium sp. TaxID=1871053 RepID=UPI001217A696|nr:DUF177 domain-containing protein [Phenylobacterium sp.]THD62940.1 MAG: DUF177 domain-containing protein [Phenylobacterium sp.]